MKSARTLHLYAVTASVLISLVCTTSAMATESTALCKAHENTCAAGNQVKTVHLVAGTVTLKTSLVTVLCLSSLMTTEPLSALGHPLLVKVTELSWVNCGSNMAHTNCKLKTVIFPVFDLLKISLNYATATVLHLGVEVSCGEVLLCTFESAETESASWEFKGALREFATGHGSLSAANWVLAKTTGLLCPAKNEWTGFYEPLEHVYVIS
jgi:hypothetical protein